MGKTKLRRRTCWLVAAKLLRQAVHQCGQRGPRVEGHVVPEVDADHGAAVVRALTDLTMRVATMSNRTSSHVYSKHTSDPLAATVGLDSPLRTSGKLGNASIPASVIKSSQALTFSASSVSAFQRREHLVVPAGGQVQHLSGVHLAADRRRQGGVPEMWELLAVSRCVSVHRAPQHLRLTGQSVQNLRRNRW